MVLLLLLSVLMGLSSVTDGQGVHLGWCPQPPVQENFNTHKVGVPVTQQTSLLRGVSCQEIPFLEQTCLKFGV